jgi:DNA-binding FadR family transcriptional regulator
MAFSLYYWSGRERQLTSIKIHREIAAAFRAKKPRSARRLVERHLLEARDQLMDMESERKPRLPAEARPQFSGR